MQGPGPADPKTIGEWIADVAHRFSSRAAIRDVTRGQACLSYGELGAQVAAAGAVLNAAGVNPGSVVVSALPDGPEALTAFLSIAAAAIVLPASPGSRPEEFRQLLAAARPAAVLVPAGRSTLREVAEREGVAIFSLHRSGSDLPGAFDLRAEARVGDRIAGRPALEDTAVIIATSGTVAIPKLVAFSHASWFATIDSTASWLGLGPQDRSLCVTPLVHLHGLARAATAPLLRGAEVVTTPGFDRARVLDWIVATRPTFLTAVPSMHRLVLQQIVESGRGVRDLGLCLLLSGSDRLDQRTKQGLEEAFGVKLLQFYGMSETSPLVAVTPTDVPVPPESVGRPNPPWSVTVLDETGARLGPEAEGEVAIQGGRINPVLGQETGQRGRYAPDGSYRTGDLGYLDKDGFLFITGRADERINKGGRKIAPRAIETVLDQHPAVRQSLVFAIPDELLGSRIGALVVLHPGCDLTEHAARAHVAESLAGYKVPDRVVFAAALPTNAVGKTTRRDLALSLGLTPPAPAAQDLSATGVADDWENFLVDCFRELLELDSPALDASFFDIGADSLRTMQLVLRIEERLGRSISPALVFAHPSIRSLAAELRTLESEKTETALIEVRKGTGRPALFIAHGLHEVGTLYAFELARALGPEQPIFALKRPRSAGAVEHPATMERLAALYLPEIRRVQPSGPYALAGYSFGGQLALEIAQQLTEAGEAVDLLFVIDEDLDLDERRAGLRRSRPDGGSDGSLNGWAVGSYVPQSYGGRVTLLRAAKDESMRRQVDPLMGWGDVAVDGVEVHDVAETHHSIVQARAVRGWAPVLARGLARIRHRVAIGPPAASETAMVRWHRALNLRRSAAVQHLIAARVAAKEGRLDDEIACYRRAVEGTPIPPAWAWMNYADALATRGQHEEALRVYEQAAQLSGWPVEPYRRLIGLNQQLGRASAVAALLQRALLLDCRDGPALADLADLAAFAGRADLAMALRARSREIRLAAPTGRREMLLADGSDSSQLPQRSRVGIPVLALAPTATREQARAAFFAGSVLLHTHIEKTGGDTLCQALKQVCGGEHVLDLRVPESPHPASLSAAERAGVWALTGHFAYGSHFPLFPTRRKLLIALVREPLERFVSYCNFVSSRPTHPAYSLIAGRTLEQTILHLVDSKHASARNNMSLMLMGYDVENVTDLKMRIDDDYFLVLPSDRVLNVYSALNRWVGTLDLTLPMYRNVGEDRELPIDSVSPEVRRRFEEANAFDFFAYEYVTQHAARQLEEAEYILESLQSGR